MHYSVFGLRFGSATSAEPNRSPETEYLAEARRLSCQSLSPPAQGTAGSALDLSGLDTQVATIRRMADRLSRTRSLSFT